MGYLGAVGALLLLAATLALARMWGGSHEAEPRVTEDGDRWRREPPERTIRFVFFVNEEPPYFWTAKMGSLVYARECKSRAENIVAMLSLETMGCYSDEPGSQHYPPPFSLMYPSRADFIGFVGNL